jgi:hypothetical protein
MKVAILALIVICSVLAPAAADLTTSANFTCIMASIGGFSAQADFDVTYNITIAQPKITLSVQTLGYFVAASQNKPTLFGFQYSAVNATVNGQAVSASYDSLGAYYALIDAFEFVPTAANKGFTAGNQILSTYKFISATIAPGCANDATYSYLSFNYGNGFKVKCRIANTPVTEPSGIVVSPVSAKCDLTFGTFNYSGRTDTRLGITVAFVVAGADATLSGTTASVASGIRGCKNSDGVCLFAGGASKAGEFTWTKSTNNTQGIVASGLTVYSGTSADFVFPDNPADKTIPSVGNTTVSVKAFAAANVVVFSFADPVAGDVWDPTLAAGDSSTLSPNSTSTGSLLNVSFLLIAIVAFLAKFL